MAIFRHPDGTHHRYPYQAPAEPTAAPEEDKESDWSQKPGARPGVQIHRDGKRMRNAAPTPPYQV